MAIFRGNLICRASFNLQSPHTLVPWCSGGRAYSSSIPVRFIPKKSSKIRESETSTQVKGAEVMKVSEKLKLESISLANTLVKVAEVKVVPNKLKLEPIGLENPPGARAELEDKLSSEGVMLDEEYMEESSEVIEEVVIRNEECREQVLLAPGKTKFDAEKLAIELLASRAFTAVEMRKKLLAKRFPVHIIDEVMTDFQTRGLINDCFYAETFAQSRWSSSSWGPMRIKQALFRKGVSKVDAEKAVKVVFQSSDCGDCEQPNNIEKLGMSKASMDHLIVQASKKWQRGGNIPIQTRKSRIIQWLQYRGFNWGVVTFILNKLTLQNPP